MEERRIFLGGSDAAYGDSILNIGNRCFLPDHRRQILRDTRQWAWDGLFPWSMRQPSCHIPAEGRWNRGFLHTDRCFHHPLTISPEKTVDCPDNNKISRRGIPPQKRQCVLLCIQTIQIMNTAFGHEIIGGVIGVADVGIKQLDAR